nr:MAG TPA: hypothetical protein [Caudoviricetes sp.]
MAYEIRRQDNAITRAQYSIREHLADPMLCGRHFRGLRNSASRQCNYTCPIFDQRTSGGSNAMRPSFPQQSRSGPASQQPSSNNTQP